MSRYSTLAQSILAAALLTAACAAHAQTSGVIRFSGRIVESPCSFSIDQTRSHRPTLHPDCPGPVAGRVSIIDRQNRPVLDAIAFDQHSGAIGLSSKTPAATGPMMLVVTYQ